MDQPPQTGFSEQPVRPEVVYAPRPPEPRRKMGLFMRLFVMFLVLGLLGSAALNLMLMAAVGVRAIRDAEEGRVQERHFALNRHGSQKVAVVSIEGTILSGEGFFKHQIDRARRDIADGNLRAIVLRVNSPGGTISGSDYMLHHLRKLVREKRIPIVVSMGAVAASGGYYASMCVGDTPNTIYAEPSTWTGSIGVLIPHYNVAELIERWGIQDDSVASNPLKTIGSIARKMTPKERQILQSLVDDGFRQFKNAVKDGRPKFRKDTAALDRVATGQIFTADQALENGLIDRIGFIEDAIDRVIELAGLNKADVEVVRYKAEPKFAELIFGQSTGRASWDLAALLESTSPRGFYLCTWLPAVVVSGQ